MNASFTQPGRMTAAEFVAWGAEQPASRYELLDGDVTAMAPERLAHVRATAAIWDRLRAAIGEAGAPCEAFIDGVGCAIDEFTVLIPDVMVRCGEPLDGNQSLVADPVIVVEVLSPSTRAVDMTHKLERYFRVPSICHYLVVRTDNPVVIHHRRTADGIAVQLVQPGPLRLDPPGIALQVG